MTNNETQERTKNDSIVNPPIMVIGMIIGLMMGLVFGNIPIGIGSGVGLGIGISAIRNIIKSRRKK